MPYQDRPLVCRDCGKEFMWTAGEQEFFAEKGFSHPPSRCKEHRIKHKAQVEGVRGLPQRREYDIVCSSCGKPGKVPFEPSTKHALLCTDCFMSQRAAKVLPQKMPVVVDNAVDELVTLPTGKKEARSAEVQVARGKERISSPSTD